MPSVGVSVAFSQKNLIRRLGGLVGWLRGGVGITVSAGKVEAWTDPLTGMTLSKLSDATRPTDSTLLGAQCPLFVDTSSTELRGDLTSTLSAFTLIMVQQWGTLDASQGAFRAATSGDVLQAYGFIDSGPIPYLQSFGTPGRTVSGSGTALGSPLVRAYVCGPRTALFKDGTKQAEAGADTISVAKLRIGTIGVGAYYHRGYIVDVVLFNRDLGDTTIAAVSAYLGKLRGVY